MTLAPTTGTIQNPLVWLAGLLALYLGIPFALFVLRMAGPGPHGFRTPGLFPALATWILTASISTGLVAACGIPLAYLLASSKGRLATLVGFVVHLPLALPPLMSGILLIYVVGPYTVIGRLFHGRLTDSLAGVVMAQMFVSSPFLIITARSAFQAVDPALLDVATTLGHRGLSRFRHVALPLAARGIRSGLTLTWLRAFGEYGATVILAYHPFTLPVYSYTQFASAGLSTTEAPTVLALATAVAVLGTSRMRFRRTVRPSRPLPSPVEPASAHPTPVSFDLDHSLGSFHLDVEHRVGSTRLAILGPSGSGKSTILRCLVGLYGSDPGPVRLGHHAIDGIPADRRQMGYVTQGLALFPHLTVWRHLVFAPGTDPRLAAHWLARCNLVDVRHHLPHQLSGGQQQRVKLAQALCRSADLLLLDEPFSALDTALRHELRHELRQLQRSSGLSTVLVTHDPEEAALLADDIIVLVDGKVLQSGERDDVFARPTSPAVARLLGIQNVHSARVVSDGQVTTGGVAIAADTAGLAPDASVWWRIQPEDVRVGRWGALRCTLVDVCDLGTVTELEVAIGPAVALRSRTSVRGDWRVGDPYCVDLPTEAITLWPKDGQGGCRADGYATSVMAGSAQPFVAVHTATPGHPVVAGETLLDTTDSLLPEGTSASQAAR